ncbi:hypothetical protein [Paraglaciecola chathamensis]|uniref:Uncharacterized protein n=1 Tax=Paraglaciecola agarilytica NO2 TaxID=1125747 RepID=A0ABQ0ICE4_9ALTE|nr:hypothetical protein [Paraglaciecola agarilytica]GAC07054.1 conserved hypothetical protein [Paraglaciecola agarilytica NO2]
MKKISNITSVFTLFPLLMLIALSGTAKPTIDEITPVLLGDLEQERGMGGAVDVTNNSHLEAVLTDNYNANSVTGNNSIDRGSFNDASGVFSIIQNTGNNVIIQESTIITVTIAPN